MKEAPIIQTQGLTKIYSSGKIKVTAINKVNLVVEKGAFVGVADSSGSGKSTLMNLLGGLDSPNSGTIAFEGALISQMDKDELARYRRLDVGMIAIVVASLGIMNTMVMSILERYSEIGIMKAVGAGDGDIKKIFFFESSVIGFFGGLFGLALGWVVSGLINRIINYFLAKQGVPFIDYFNFPWWLCLGAVLFAIVMSLVSGIYPAIRAARVDPVVALRHE